MYFIEFSFFKKNISPSITNYVKYLRKSISMQNTQMDNPTNFLWILTSTIANDIHSVWNYNGVYPQCNSRLQKGKIKPKTPNEVEKDYFTSSTIISKVKTLKLCMANKSVVKWRMFSVLIILILLCNFLKVFTDYDFIFDFSFLT